jgi:uncharacterized protein YndB with AHSA1/START domain
VDPVTLEITIDRPREEVFAYLADIANHPEFTDHYLKDWRLTREESEGKGAGARYRADQRFNRFGWYDMTFVDVEAPFRIRAVGRGGKFNRSKTFTEWTLHPTAGGTRLEYMTEIEAPLPTDRAFEALAGTRRFFRRGARRALKRLQSILEENRDRGARATIAGL